MKVLVLGGTHFIGRTLVERLQHYETLEITLFNRGISNPNLFTQLKSIYGDRETEEDLNQVFKEEWDIVIDCSGYFPKSVRQLISGLNHTLTKYIYVSTCSVYDHDKYEGEMRDEDSPAHFCKYQEESDNSTTTYGKRKSACEKIVKNSNIPFVILRPALVFGPYDQTDRFYYWLHSIKNRNKILLPEGGERRFSMTYVEDLVEAIIQSIFNKDLTGIFNAVSYPSATLKELVEIGSKILESKPTLIAASANYLFQNNVTQWTDIPLWLSSDEYTYANRKLWKTLSLEPTVLQNAISKTIAYFNSTGFNTPKVGMGIDQHQSLIKRLENDY